MKFEEKMLKVESIISELEKDEINLDDSIEKYTEAMKLIKECDEALRKAEDKISKIVTEDGSIKTFEVEE